MENNYTKKLTISGLLLAIGIIIPSIFHSTGLPGNVFLPMHIPVLVGGFLLPPGLAFLLGLLTPVINTILTGMPKLFPMAIIMMFELGVYGLAVSIMYRKLGLPSYIALIISLVLGRLTAGIVVFILSTFFGVELSPLIFLIGAVTKGLPGILIQIILIPILINGIMRYTTLNIDWY